MSHRRHRRHHRRRHRRHHRRHRRHHHRHHRRHRRMTVAGAGIEPQAVAVLAFRDRHGDVGEKDCQITNRSGGASVLDST